MWWAIFKCVKVMMASIFLGLVVTTGVNAWAPNLLPDFKMSDVKVYHSNLCPGNYGTIAVHGEGTISACIMGEDVKVASYFTAEGGVSYAVRFPSESAYYRLDVCQGQWGCIYSGQNDTFAGYGGVYKNFVRNLTRSVQNGVVHFGPSEQSVPFSISQFAGKSYQIESIATSQNGAWVLFELRSYGVFRLNVQTLEVRRVIALSFSYGLGNDPRLETAISNDGNTIAVMGYRMGVGVVAIDETCGDKPTASMQTYYAGAVTACRYLHTPTDQYIPQFKHAVRPLFSKDDKTLSFDVFSYDTAARHITLFADKNVNNEGSYYLALGDSFTSGEGELDDSFYLGGAANRCHVSSRSYPFLLGSAWDIPRSSAACSGATIQSARGASSNPVQPVQMSGLESNPPHIATIGLGGNDAGLIGKLKDCLGLDTCKWASTAEDRYSTALEIKNLYPRLKEFYVDVKVRTLGAVIVVGYPRIVSSQPTCQSAVGILLNETERVFMNEAIHYLNQVIQAAATDSGVEYADVENVFGGGELCSSPDSPLMNAIRIGDDYPNIEALPFIKIVGAESFHPKPDGHAKVAAKIFQDFPDTSAFTTYINSGTPTAVPTPGAYWNADVNSVKPQKALLFLNKITIKKKDLFEISLPAASFWPSSDIVLELHSDVKSLGTFKSAEDGSLAVTLASDDFEPGFHTVHAIGKNFAGNDIDTYDFLTVEEEAVEGDIVEDVEGGTIEITPPSSVPVIPAGGGGKPQYLLPVAKAAGFAPAGVQGASVASNHPVSSIATLDPVASAQKEATLPINAPETDTSSNYGVLVVVTAILGLIALLASLYGYYQQKQARNTG